MTRLIQSLFVAAVLLLSGCSLPQKTAEAYQTAESLEQKAFALYGTFVIYQERGADMLYDESIPLDVRRTIARAEEVANPAAGLTLEAAKVVARTRRAFDENQATISRLIYVTKHLEAEYGRLKPLMGDFIDAVD